MLPRTMIEQCGSYEFAMEPLSDALVEELRPINDAIAAELDGETAAVDYDLWKALNERGRYVVFTARHEGALIGACTVHVQEAARSRSLVAHEDAMYVRPEHRVGRLAFRFTEYVIARLTEIGVRDFSVTARVGTRSERFFDRIGMRLVAHEYRMRIGG